MARKPATAPRPPVAWRAGPDQIGHAFEASRRPATKTLCGLRLTDPRWAWPAIVRCPDCQMVAEREARIA